MTVVAFISQKGGVGKSTLSRALAVECAKSNISVKIADCDFQQGTVLDWNQARKDNNLIPSIDVNLYESVEKCLRDISVEKYDILIIDNPARTSQGTLLLAQKADLLIQPVGASRDELIPSIRDFNSLVDAGISKDKLIFALSRIGNENEAISAKEFIEGCGYPVLDGFLPEKPSYRQAQNEGKSLTEVSYKSLRNKADRVLQSIVDKLN